jgi:hypothetical protein
MENTDKGLIVPKWVLKSWPKKPLMPRNLSSQIICPSPKVWDFDEKRLHWASVVRTTTDVEIEKIQEKYLQIRVFFKK